MKFSTVDNDNDRMVVTVQLYLRVDGGTITVTTLISIYDHLMQVQLYSPVR